MADGYPQPVFLDTTVISNYASSNSIGFLVHVLESPVVVLAVRDEIEQGADLGHEYLTTAVEAFDELMLAVIARAGGRLAEARLVLTSHKSI